MTQQARYESIQEPLDDEELDAIVEAAHRQGVSTEEFVKRLVLCHLRADQT